MEESTDREFIPKEQTITDWLKNRAEQLEIEDDMQKQIPKQAVGLLILVERDAPGEGLYYNPEANYRCLERKFPDNWLLTVVQGDDGDQPDSITVAFSRKGGPGGDIDIIETLASIDIRQLYDRPRPFDPRVTGQHGERLPVDDLVYIHRLLEELTPEDSKAQ
jgi:hypothetical protein